MGALIPLFQNLVSLLAACITPGDTSSTVHASQGQLSWEEESGQRKSLWVKGAPHPAPHQPWVPVLRPAQGLVSHSWEGSIIHAHMGLLCVRDALKLPNSAQ